MALRKRMKDYEVVEPNSEYGKDISKFPRGLTLPKGNVIEILEYAFKDGVIVGSFLRAIAGAGPETKPFRLMMPEFGDIDIIVDLDWLVTQDVSREVRLELNWMHNEHRASFTIPGFESHPFHFYQLQIKGKTQTVLRRLKENWAIDEGAYKQLQNSHNKSKIKLDILFMSEMLYQATLFANVQFKEALESRRFRDDQSKDRQFRVGFYEAMRRLYLIGELRPLE